MAKKSIMGVPPAFPSGSSSLVRQLQQVMSLWHNPRGIESICFPGYPGVAHPVPFFGDISSSKPKVFTIGANPSDREFLESNKVPLNSSRFPGYNPSSWKSLFQACNDYFFKNHNPYAKWFGKSGGVKMEGFVNMFGASYYDNHNFDYQAIHIDLMPFPTDIKFGVFYKLNGRIADYFIQNSGLPLIMELIRQYKPVRILCVGKFSNEYFFGSPLGKETIKGIPFSYYKGKINGVMASGTTIYYPNTPSTPAQWKHTIYPLIV